MNQTTPDFRQEPSALAVLLIHPAMVGEQLLQRILADLDENDVDTAAEDDAGKYFPVFSREVGSKQMRFEPVDSVVRWIVAIGVEGVDGTAAGDTTQRMSGIQGIVERIQCTSAA